MRSKEEILKEINKLLISKQIAEEFIDSIMNRLKDLSNELDIIGGYYHVRKDL